MRRYSKEPKKGDKIWHGYEAEEGRQPNGYVAWTRGDTVMVVLHGNSGERNRTKEMEKDDFLGNWTDNYGGLWLIEVIS